jgi:hypothetical protein
MDGIGISRIEARSGGQFAKANIAAALSCVRGSYGGDDRDANCGEVSANDSVAAVWTG